MKFCLPPSGKFSLPRIRKKSLPPAEKSAYRIGAKSSYRLQLFADTPASKPQGGATGLPNAGTSTDAGKTMKRWRRLAGLDDSNDNA